MFTVTAPVPLETETPVPATADVTPELVIVTAPVALETEIPEPATLLVTPVFVTDTAPVAEALLLSPEEEVNEVTPPPKLSHAEPDQYLANNVSVSKIN
jgi:hypothetical protein